MVSANHWLRGIKTYRLLWYLTRVSANYASSNWARLLNLKYRPLGYFGRSTAIIKIRTWYLSVILSNFDECGVPPLHLNGMSHHDCIGPTVNRTVYRITQISFHSYTKNNNFNVKSFARSIAFTTWFTESNSEKAHSEDKTPPPPPPPTLPLPRTFWLYLCTKCFRKWWEKYEKGQKEYLKQRKKKQNTIYFAGS